MAASHGHMETGTALYSPNRYWIHLEASGYGDTEQDAINALVDGVLSIADSDQREAFHRFCSALMGVLDMGDSHE